MSILLMVKKSPSQVGYGKLQTFQCGHVDTAARKEKARRDAGEAKDTWHRNNNGWKFRIVDEADFGSPPKLYKWQAYYDDIMEKNP